MKLIFKDVNELRNTIKDVKEDVFLSFDESLSVNDLTNQVKEVLELENEELPCHIFLCLKKFSHAHKLSILKYAMHYDNLCDLVLLLNILNLIKCYNDLEDSFFKDDYILFDAIDDMLDYSVELTEDITYLKRELNLAFLSVFKSYHKFTYADTDNFKPCLTKLLHHLLLSCDLLTLSSIFATSESINTNDCYYVKNAMFYIQELFSKNAIFQELTTNIIKGK